MRRGFFIAVVVATTFWFWGCPSSKTRLTPGGDAGEDVAAGEDGGARGDGLAEVTPGELPGGEILKPPPDMAALDASPRPEGCCSPEQTCPPDSVCALEDHKVGGVCKPVPEEGRCWRQEDCPEGTTCWGALVCPCGANCDQEDQLGDCVTGTTEDLCCFADWMCPEGLHCVGGMPGGMPGTCVYHAPDGHCWEDDECDQGQKCLGVELCECSAGCLDPEGPTAGTCVVPACETQSLDGSGLGMPCPTGLECAGGFEANLCSHSIFGAPDLPAFCTMHCASELVDCGPDAFCLPMGYSSICVPDTCYDAFVHTCITDSQCKVASNWIQCCVCPEAVTIMEMELEPCMFEGSQPPNPFPLYCDNDCDGDEWCEECPSPLGVKCEDYTCLFTSVR